MILTIRNMEIGDYEKVLGLWQGTEHLMLNECDSREGIALYLDRNPALCFVAEQNGMLVGSVLCGHDGRRGILPIWPSLKRIANKELPALSSEKFSPLWPSRESENAILPSKTKTFPVSLSGSIRAGFS